MSVACAVTLAWLSQRPQAALASVAHEAPETHKHTVELLMSEL